MFIWDGNKDIEMISKWCDIALVTGSTVVNGTIDPILKSFDKVSKRIIFYGNTITGVISLMGFDHICPYSS